MYAPLWIAVLAGGAYLLTRKSNLFASFMSALNVTDMPASKIDFVKRIGSLHERSKGGVPASSWAQDMIKVGYKVVVDSDAAQGRMPSRGSLNIYAIDPEKLAELTHSGQFVEYIP